MKMMKMEEGRRTVDSGEGDFDALREDEGDVSLSLRRRRKERRKEGGEF